MILKTFGSWAEHDEDFLFTGESRESICNLCCKLRNSRNSSFNSDSIAFSKRRSCWWLASCSALRNVKLMRMLPSEFSTTDSAVWEWRGKSQPFFARRRDVARCGEMFQSLQGCNLQALERKQFLGAIGSVLDRELFSTSSRQFPIKSRRAPTVPNIQAKQASPDENPSPSYLASENINCF